jgi:hypothetical protein
VPLWKRALLGMAKEGMGGDGPEVLRRHAGYETNREPCESQEVYRYEGGRDCCPVLLSLFVCLFVDLAHLHACMHGFQVSKGSRLRCL